MIGLPPVLISLIILEFSPMPAIASTIKNLLHSLIGMKKDEGKPKFVVMVVKTEARRKNRIKNGKIFFRSNVLVCSFFALLVRKAANPRVIGIIASVRVSFTVTALSSVAFPKWYMLSQVDAAAVTEEVSLIAVPANTPKAFPECVLKWSILPKAGKVRAAITLKKKITEIA